MGSQDHIILIVEDEALISDRDTGSIFHQITHSPAPLPVLGATGTGRDKSRKVT
jgi:hypothetical protein